MSAETHTRLDVSTSEGHVAILSSGLHAIFQTSLPRIDSYYLGKQWFTYGRVIADANLENTLRLTRTDYDRRLVPEGRGPFDAVFRNILAVPEKDVDTIISEMGSTACNSIYRETTPIERLYLAAVALRQPMDGIRFESCATYEVSPDGVRLAVVDENGGYTVGWPPSEGIASRADLVSIEMAIRAA